MRFLTSLCFAIFVVYINAATLNIKNLDDGEIWIGIQPNDGYPVLANGGFKLAQGATVSVQAPDDWSGRFWSRTWCNSGSNHCETGDCGNKVECAGAGGQDPFTVVEITFHGYGGLAYYDVSLVDGFNSRASIAPVGGTSDGSQYSCATASCPTQINGVCPDELKLYNDDGSQVIGCKSACTAFGTDQYCCKGNYKDAATCKSSAWPVDYPAKFKSWCPLAYSYAYDDHKASFTCNANTYNINFGNV